MLSSAALKIETQTAGLLLLDHNFTLDIYGAYCAEFSMGHEALGYWMSHELGGKQSVITELLSIIEQLQHSRFMDYELEGSEYNLILSREEAIIRAHALDSNFDDGEPEEELDFYDQESFARCGLDDFKDILLQWQSFTAQQN